MISSCRRWFLLRRTSAHISQATFASHVRSGWKEELSKLAKGLALLGWPRCKCWKCLNPNRELTSKAIQPPSDLSAMQGDSDSDMPLLSSVDRIGPRGLQWLAKRHNTTYIQCFGCSESVFESLSSKHVVSCLIRIRTLIFEKHPWRIVWDWKFDSTQALGSWCDPFSSVCKWWR